jgi:hypothetical protein
MARFAPSPPKPPSSTNGAASLGPDARAPDRKAPRLAGRRNLPLVALGVLLIAGCAIGFSSAWLRAGGREQVLVAANNVPAGGVLTSSDLRSAQMSIGTGVAFILAADGNQVVGRAVTSAITTGTLLAPSDVTGTPGPPSGRAVVGLALKPGQYPANIETGDRVLVVINNGGSTSSGPTNSPTSPTTTAPVEATVVEVDQAPANSSESVVVSVQMPQGNGAAVASAASGGDVALVVVSSGNPS